MPIGTSKISNHTQYKGNNTFQSISQPHLSNSLLAKKGAVKGENKLKPLLKWPGGKEKELKFIIPNAPTFKNYYEPFVGGGSVFAAFTAHRYFINDKSEELIELYHSIATKDIHFFNWAYSIDKIWTKLYQFATQETFLTLLYQQFRKDEIDEITLFSTLESHIKKEAESIDNIISSTLKWHRNKIQFLLESTLKRKFLRMKKIERERLLMPDNDILDNIITAYMGSFYTYLRLLYNDILLRKDEKALHIALFLFLRYYAYSGMFRYNDKGKFNVPYGGISYNKKTLHKELAYYQSEILANKLAFANISNLDFEQFFHCFPPTKHDFVFIDPPYDSEFSTYAQHSFTKDDQKRLAHYLIHQCLAKWMMIIKATPFILSLYENKGLNIKAFDKKYQVSFMDRNEKNTKHLIITNY